MSQPSTLGTLINDATRAALSNPDVATNLSPQSILISQVATTTIAGATGAASASDVAKALTEAAISQMATSMMASGVRSLADAVPIVQQVVAVVGMVVDWVNGIEEEAASADALYQGGVLQAEKFFRAVGSVADGKCPADVFAPYDADDAVRLGGTFEPSTSGMYAMVRMPGHWDASHSVQEPFTGASRSKLGTALINATEGGDPNAINHNQFLSNGKWVDYSAWTESFRSSYKEIEKLVPGAGLPWAKNAGIPKGRRDVYRLLRVAMQAQRKYLPKGAANGGISLWPIYMDMLHEDFRLGRLSYPFVAMSADWGMKILHATGRVVEDMVHQWELRVDPWYQEGQDAQLRAQEEALAIAEGMGPANRLTALAITISSSPRPKRPRIKIGPV